MYVCVCVCVCVWGGFEREPSRVAPIGHAHAVSHEFGLVAVELIPDEGDVGQWAVRRVTVTCFRELCERFRLDRTYEYSC